MAVLPAAVAAKPVAKSLFGKASFNILNVDIFVSSRRSENMIRVGEDTEVKNLREIVKVNSIHFQWKLIVYVLALAILIGLVLYLPLPYWLLPSVGLGLAYAHAVELQHQCLHNTAYRSRFWGRVVGVLLGLPSLVSFSDYQNSHLKHHRLLGTPEDKEFFNYAYQKLNSFPALITHLWMVRHYRDVMGYIGKSALGKLVRKDQATVKMAKKIRFEYQLMAVFLATMAFVTIFFDTTLFLKLWLIPLLVAVPTHALIELPEHIGCNTTRPDVLVNTRTIKTNKLLVWFVNGNNYHVEHHWLPAVPNDKFPELHALVSSRITYADISYRSFYAQFLRNLRQNNLHQAWEPATVNFRLIKTVSVSDPKLTSESAMNEATEAPEKAVSAKSSSASA
jgi:fatty acid desaturase